MFGLDSFAKVTKPRRLLCFGGSSIRFAARPCGLDLGIAVQPELRHESAQHAKEANAVVEAALHERVEAIGGERRPLAVHFDDEWTLAGLETGAEGCAVPVRLRA